MDIPDIISICAIDQFLSELNTTYQINNEIGPLSEIVESGNYTISINTDPCFIEKRITVIGSSINLELPNII